MKSRFFGSFLAVGLFMAASTSSVQAFWDARSVSELPGENDWNLGLDWAQVTNPNSDFPRSSRRSTFDSKLAIGLSPVAAAEAGFRISADPAGATWESFSLGARYLPSSASALRLDLDLQHYYSERGQYVTGSTAAGATPPQPSTFVVTGTESTPAFVAGLGAELRKSVTSSFSLGLGSPPDASRNWDLFVSRMDGANNTATLALPVSARVNLGHVQATTIAGLRHLWGGGSAGADFTPITFMLSYSYSESSRIKAIYESPGNLRSSNGGAESVNLSNQRVYDLYDQTVGLGFQTEL